MNRILPNPKFIEILARYDSRRPKEKAVGVFNGGGACGVFEFGSAMYLADIGVLKRFDLFVGTSAGGLNALTFSIYLNNLDKCKERIWDRIKKNTDIYNREVNVPTIIWQLMAGSESVLDPKGLNEMALREFSDCELNVPVIITTTDLGIGYCDGGWGNNSAIDAAVREKATKVYLSGCSPDVKKEMMIEYKFPAGKASCVKEALDTARIPFLFPIRGKNGKVKLIDVIKTAPGSIAELFEEWEWKYFEQYQATLKDPVEKAECYPVKTLGSMDDYTHIQEWMQAGYDRAVEIFTPEYVDAWLNS